MAAVEAKTAALEHHLMQAAKIVEEQVDSELKKLENPDEDELESLRRRRMEQLKRVQKQKQDWLSAGHCTYSEIANEPEFFAAGKRSNRMVVHFYEESNRQCELMDKILEAVCQQHIETRFIKVKASKVPFLVKRLNIRVLPTLACVKDGQTVDYVRGSSVAGPGSYNEKDLTQEMVEWRLGRAEVIRYDGDKQVPPNERANKPTVNFIAKSSTGIRGPGPTESDDDDDW